MSRLSHISAALASFCVLLASAGGVPAHSQDMIRPGMLARKLPSPHDPGNPIFRDQAKRENCARIEEDASGEAHCIPQIHDATPTVTPPKQ